MEKGKRRVKDGEGKGEKREIKEPKRARENKSGAEINPRSAFDAWSVGVFGLFPASRFLVLIRTGNTITHKWREGKYIISGGRGSFFYKWQEGECFISRGRRSIL